MTSALVDSGLSGFRVTTIAPSHFSGQIDDRREAPPEERKQGLPLGEKAVILPICFTARCVRSRSKPSVEACRANHEASTQEPGNRRFDVLQDANDPTHFVLYEAYATAEAAAAHKETAHYLNVAGNGGSDDGTAAGGEAVSRAVSRGVRPPLLAH
jgi:quinol monooxygenase YgiN